MNIKTFIIRMTRQHYTGLYIGAAMDAYSRASIMINPILFLNTIIILYSTTVHANIPWLIFYAYVLIWVAFVIVLLFLALKIAMPSNYAWHWQQSWQHPNPFKDAIVGNTNEIAILKGDMEILKKQNTEILECLKRLSVE